MLIIDPFNRFSSLPTKYTAQLLEKITADNLVEKFHEAINIINTLCGISFDSHTVFHDGTVFFQKIEKTTFTVLFDYIKTHDVHQGLDNHKCSFHTESLYDHLLNACVVTVATALVETKGDIFISSVAGFTALVHDFGKIATASPCGNGHVAYPYHGEFGAIIIQRAFNNDFDTTMRRFFPECLPKRVWNDICASISTHMCSYHVTNNETVWNKCRINSVARQPIFVRNILMFLAYGDTFGALPEEFTEHEEFLSFRQKWWQMIQVPSSLKRDKICILVRGRSNGGKSVISSLIHDQLFAKNISSNIISRDNVMAHVVSQYPESGINFNGTRLIDSQYILAYNFYTKNKLGKNVNDKMREFIKHSINTNVVTIIDTQMTMFDGADYIFPSNISRCNVLAVDVTRNAQVFDDSKNGKNLSDQLKMSGDSDALHPFCVDGVNLYNMQSMYCSSEENTQMVEYVFSIVSTDQFSNLDTLGLDYFLEFLHNMITSISDIPDGMRKNPETMHIDEYMNYLMYLYDNNVKKVKDQIAKQHYTIKCPSAWFDTEFFDRVVCIKYLDGINRNWNVWGREARGCTLFLCDDGKWRIIKMLLQRGAEVLTGQQKARGFTSTENVDLKVDGKALHLSSDQRALMEDLLNDRIVNLMATSKKDGSMLVICQWTGEMASVMRQLYFGLNNTFVNTCIEMYDEIVGHSQHCCMLMTQGTMFMSSEMERFMVTAMFPDNELSSDMSPSDIIRTYGRSIFKSFTQMFSELSGDYKTLIFEAICANRMSYTGEVHTELAVSYPTSGITFLSATEIYANVIGDGSYHYIPHFNISDLIHKCGFMEPAFWNFVKSSDIDDFLQNIDAVAHRNMDVDTFFINTPPLNKYPYEKIVDFEGLVVYDTLRDLSYAKIKTDTYYKCHCFHEYNIQFLCDVAPSVGHIFPLARVVHTIYTSLNDKCAIVNTQLVELLEKNVVLRDALQPKARIALDRLASDKKKMYCILMQNNRKLFGQLAIPIFLSVFTTLNYLKKIRCDNPSDERVKDFDMESFCIGYVTRINLWNWTPDTVLDIDDDSRSFLVNWLLIADKYVTV
jgi:hypothetical protein